MVDINLLPWRQLRYANKLKRKKYSLIILSSVVVIVVVCVHVFCALSINTTNLHVIELKNKLLQMSESDKETTLFSDLIKSQSSHQVLHEFLNKLESAHVYSIRIKKINYTDKQVEILGHAQSTYEMMHWMSHFHVKNYKIKTNNKMDGMRFDLVIE